MRLIVNCIEGSFTEFEAYHPSIGLSKSNKIEKGKLTIFFTTEIRKELRGTCYIVFFEQFLSCQLDGFFSSHNIYCMFCGGEFRGVAFH